MEPNEFKKGMRLVSKQNGLDYIVEKVTRQSVEVRWITKAGTKRVLYKVPMYRAMRIFRKESA